MINLVGLFGMQLKFKNYWNLQHNYFAQYLLSPNFNSIQISKNKAGTLMI